MDRKDSHAPYADEAVERAFSVTMENKFTTAKDLFDIVCEQINSLNGGFVPTSTKEMAERLHINDIDELPLDQEYSFINESHPSGHDFRVYISSFQDGEGGDYAYLVEVWETDYCGHIASVDNKPLFDSANWHRGLVKNS